MASEPPQLVSRLQNVSTAYGWYPASPTWFGLGGKTGDRNHTEVLATYDNDALYIAFLNIDRSTFVYPQYTSTDLTLVDSNGIWIETPEGRRFYLLATVDTRYPAQPERASGEFPDFDGKEDRLSGWTSRGWFAGNLTMQQTIIIPWSTLHTSAPEPGSRWRVNFLNYNQTSSSTNPSTVVIQKWAPGAEDETHLWGTLSFGDPALAPYADVSPEAVLTLRPATGFGGEVTLRAGNYADQTNQWADEAVTQSNWNDWDPVDYTIKEYLQFDLSLVPRDRKIISATLLNYCRGNYNANPTDQYLHVVRLSSEFDPDTVTMLTSPLPIENGFRRLVRNNEGKTRIEIDVTDVVLRALHEEDEKAVFALAGSSGDINNGKIWGVSYGRADWYDGQRPRLIITFGKPGVTYDEPVRVGSLNYTSVATTSCKNKLTNGTFRYGTVEGISNTTYWLDPGFAYVNGRNVPFMQMVGDVNPNTGNPALRLMTPVSWKSMSQKATGIIAGRQYTYSGWYKSAVVGHRADVRLIFRDKNDNTLDTRQAAYSGSGDWERVRLTRTAPEGTDYILVSIYNWNSGEGTYMLLSDLQLEEGSSATAYSETMGVFYPDHPRTDGTVVPIPPTGDNCIRANKLLGTGADVSLNDRVVTGSFPGFFYIQCPEPGHSTCGIKVAGNSSPELGSAVNVTGTLAMDGDGELVINSSFAISGTALELPKPVARLNRIVGGGTEGHLRGPDGGSGLNTVGTLQTTWGLVRDLVPNVSMIVDDGSGSPVKVIGPTGTASKGSFVVVTGIAGLEKVGTEYRSILRTRTGNDIHAR